MFSEAIVFVLLSVMIATATYAAGAPVGKQNPEQFETGDQDNRSAGS